MKRVLVTGGSRGLGLAICRRLLSERYHIIAASRKQSQEIAELGREYPAQIEHFSVDFARPESLMELARATRVLDGLSGFVANAAVGTDGLLTLTSEMAIRECVQVNLLAPIVLTREVVKGMLAGGGSLIFISSIAARTGFAGLTVYSATKGALLAFSRSLAREYGERGVRSNCILPGFLETEMSATLVGDQRERIASRTALRRLGCVQDVVGCVSYLLSDDARYVTGAEFVIDGGMTA